MFNFLKKQPEIHASAIILAAGSGSRMNSDISKQLMLISDIPVIAYSLIAFENTPCIDEIIIVTKQEDILCMSDIARDFNIFKVTDIVTGGDTRQESVFNGLSELKNAEFVAIHDGARPCITPEQITETVHQAVEHGAAAIGQKVQDTIKIVEQGFIHNTVDRSSLWQIQTPQVFKTDTIMRAHQTSNILATDDTALVQNLGVKVKMVEGNSENIKITTQSDLLIAQAILESRDVR